MFKAEDPTFARRENINQSRELQMDTIDSLYPAPSAQNGIIEVSTPSAFKRPRTNEHQVETEGSPLVEIVKVTQEPPRRSSRKITPRSLSMCSHKSAQKNTHKPNSKPAPGVTGELVPLQ